MSSKYCELWPGKVLECGHWVVYLPWRSGGLMGSVVGKMGTCSCRECCVLGVCACVHVGGGGIWLSLGIHGH